MILVGSILFIMSCICLVVADHRRRKSKALYDQALKLSMIVKEQSEYIGNDLQQVLNRLNQRKHELDCLESMLRQWAVRHDVIFSLQPSEKQDARTDIN